MRKLTDDEIIKLGLAITKKHSPNAKWSSVVTFERNSREPRFFLIDNKKENIFIRTHTSHGSGSGGIDGLNLKFSNTPNSHMSSIGLMKWGETYFSTKFNGLSCRIDGLDPKTNSNVRRRAIVGHPSDYLSVRFIRDRGYPGRSQGCFALGNHVSEDVFTKLKNGSMLFVVSKDNIDEALKLIGEV